ncbi:MAG: hypothetical protein ACLR4Z_05210 [Butyricicoccaceae bacterium]
MKTCITSRAPSWTRPARSRKADPVVTDVQTWGVDTEELLSLALSLEKRSDHPLADAIVRYALEQGREGAQCD